MSKNETGVNIADASYEHGGMMIIIMTYRSYMTTQKMSHRGGYVGNLITVYFR